MRPLLLATRNAHKTREFAEILGAEFQVQDLTTTDLAAAEETGRTFAENATLKALAVSRVVDELVVADDSGLEVDALKRAPGVYSARYAGENATDEANVAKLLAALALTKDRAARFTCVIAVAQSGQLLATFTGTVEGAIARSRSGEHGFGYDPVFVPEHHAQTFAELPAAVKNRISHRARAIEQLRAYLSLR